MTARAVALVGLTASGKSKLALEVAAAAGDVEIISVDSMAVYRAMDIATAKPGAADRARVPHHMIDILDPWEECTVALFQSATREAMAEVAGRARISLLVGGTGLYHRAVIDDLEIPGRYPEVRRTLESSLGDQGGTDRLYEQLCGLDPAAAARIEPGNERRIVRALEVTLGSGRPFSSFGSGFEAYPPSAIKQVGLAIDLAELDQRIEARVDGWLAGGLFEEVRTLFEDPRGLSLTARQAIGYREVAAYLAGSCTIEDARAATIARTRALARRQRAWFRRDPRITWCTPDSIRAVLEEEVAVLKTMGEMED